MLFPSPSESEKGLVGPPDLWEMKRQFQIAFLKQQGLQPSHSLLDFGCGNLRGGLPLIEYLNREKYTGADIRTELIESAKKEVKTHSLQEKFPKLLVFPGEWAQVTGRNFDFLWAFSVLFHIPDKEMAGILRMLRQCAHTHSLFWANVHIGPPQAAKWREFPFVQREWDWYEDVFQEAGWVIENIGSLQQFGHIHPRLSQEEQQNQRMIKATPDFNQHL